MPQFQVTHKTQQSDWHTQRTGIRQGCPLSPYLLILTVHVMFSDVSDKFNDPRYRKPFQGMNFQDLLYADDTLVVAKSRKSANDYLRLIEEESEYLQLTSNHTKCCYISYNCGGVVRFSKTAKHEVCGRNCPLQKQWTRNMKSENAYLQPWLSSRSSMFCGLK